MASAERAPGAVAARRGPAPPTRRARLGNRDDPRGARSRRDCRSSLSASTDLVVPRESPRPGGSRSSSSPGEDFSPAFDREAYTEALLEALRRHRVGTVAMAGFATVLSPGFFPAFDGRVLNTHPSLLPAYRGWHAVPMALAAGETTTGCTVHLATSEVDEGPVLAQERVPIHPGDTEETLHERIKEVERRLYPATVRSFLASTEETAGGIAAPEDPEVMGR